MNNKEFSLLILGNFESVYIVQFIKNLKKENPRVHLFFWGYTREEKKEERSFVSCYDDYCLFDIQSIVNSSFGWRFKAIKGMRDSFKNFVAGKHFDYVNIHYVKPEYYFLLDYFEQCASKLILTPWGSDVYRVHGLNKLLVQRTFNAADFLTGCDDRFTRDFKNIFKVPQSKIVYCDLGVEPIEYIFEHKHIIDTKEAKRQLGLDNHYIITCGYNAHQVQHHSEIIEAVYHVKDKLPDNLLLLFPFTYPKEPEYIQSIKQKVDSLGLKAVYFENFVELPQLFLMRQATDIFIHVQPTDASSGSLYEYVVCEKKIINGSWLQYPELFRNGVKPYFEVDSLENLGKTIVDVYHSEPIKIEQDLLDNLAKKQWKVVIKDWNRFLSDNLISD